MRNLRNLLLLGSAIVLAACATQTFRPEDAPEYVITRDPTPFYMRDPKQKGGPDASLNTMTRVKLLRKKGGYSLVLLEDSRTGYVANAYITVAPPGSQTRPFGSGENDSQTRPSRKKRASASPTPEPGQVNQVPSSETNAPAPDLQSPPEAIPSPTPVPETPLEKPKFRL